MAIPPTTSLADNALNTVAVVPFDLAPATASSSRAGAAASSLAAAASNLISAIAQGSAFPALSDTPQDRGNGSDDESDDGSSSFTYTAPAPAPLSAEQEEWYISIPYHISNRYYDADITLKATKLALPSSSQARLPQTFPAYIVVLDRSRPLEHHHRLAQNLDTKVASGFDADISIVAGVSIFSSSNAQLVTAIDDEPSLSSSRGRVNEERAKTSDLVSLYADYGWEFIAIDDVAEDESDEGHAYSDDSEMNREAEDDKDGMERIREALMNHMWHGLVRKDTSAPAANRREANGGNASQLATGSWGIGFSDTFDAEVDDDFGDQDRSLPLDPAIVGPSDTPFPPLATPTHAETSALDEQLASLFLSSSDTTEMTTLEAFLESSDPSWPAAQSPTSQTFEDDFQPFQSGSSPPIDLPSSNEIEQMQGRLFSRQSDQDLAGQLQQLQWHAERVRGIEDQEVRRKEAALVALAFSMQWSDEGEAQSGDVKDIAF